MDDIEINKISNIVIDEVNNLQILNFHEHADLSDQARKRSAAGLMNLRAETDARFSSIQGWFLRCSWLIKVDILKRSAWLITNLKTLILILNTIYTARCKDWIYSANQGLDLYISDIILNDNNRNLDQKVLEKVINHDLNWFRTISDFEQYKVIMDMIRLADTCIVGKIFYEFLIIFKSRIREVLKIKILEELKQRPLPDEEKITKKIKNKDKVKKDKKDKKGKKKKDTTQDKIEKQKQKELLEIEKQKQKELEEIEEQKQKELEEIYAFLNEKFLDDPNDPLNIELEDLMQTWDLFMSSYNKKVGIGVVPKKPKATKKDKGKKGKGKIKKEKISKDLADDIQLLPIWVNKKLIASIDPKTFKNVKKVNKYWNFIVKGIKQDHKSRQALKKSRDRLKKGLKICNIEEIVPKTQLYTKYTKISCVTDKIVRKNMKYNSQTTNTLVDDLYKNCNKFFGGTNLESFPRNIYVTNPTEIFEI